jgi:hypothetical protein
VATNGAVNIYDSQSGDIIHIIRSNNITRSRFSIDGGKVLVTSRNSGDIWDITTNTFTHLRSIDYNGEQAVFSPDGTRIASICGKFVKIWKTNIGYNHHEASTHVHHTIDGISISPDEQLVILKSGNGVNILDATTGQTLFTCLVIKVQSIVFLLDSTFVAFFSLKQPHGTDMTICTVHTWNAHTRHHKSIVVDGDVLHIALSPDGSQFASLSPSHMQLWDLKSEGCLAHLEFRWRLQVQAQISFSTNAKSVSVLENNGDVRSWCISPNHSSDLTENSIENNDGTNWLISHPLESSPYIYYPNCTTDLIENCEGTKLPMVFVPTTEERLIQDASAPCQSYHHDMDDEWILDQDGRRVLWIPPDERPRKIWGGFKRGKKVHIQTESGKVCFSSSLYTSV